MRYALLATTSLVTLALASYACSSSDDKATTTPDAGKAQTSTSSSGKGDDDDVASSSGSTSGETSSGSTSGSTSGTASSSGDAAASSSGSSSGASSSGTPVDGGDTAGTKCVTGDQQETSADNGAQGGAQVLTATSGTSTTGFCGRITAGDTDFWTYTFTVDGAFSYSANASFSATAPTITIITGGEEFPFNAVPNGKIKSGQAVVFKVTSPTAVDYHISFNVTKT